MSDAAAAPAPKKKGKMKLIILIAVAAIVMIGGGIGAGLYASSAMGHGGKEEHEDPDAPKLVHKEGAPEAPAGARPSAKYYTATYVPIEQPFTANLQDTDGLVQLGLGVSTFYDSKVVDNIKAHEMPVRDAVLRTLTDQDPVAITTSEGKEALQKALTKAINATLEKKAGFGGIDDVYFTSFIVQ